MHTAHLQICTSYIQCKKGVAHVKPCSEGTMWDDKKQTCDHPTENNSCMKILGKYNKANCTGITVFCHIRHMFVLCIPVLRGVVVFLVFKQYGSVVTEMSAALLVDNRFEYL